MGRDGEAPGEAKMKFASWALATGIFLMATGCGDFTGDRRVPVDPVPEEDSAETDTPDADEPPPSDS